MDEVEIQTLNDFDDSESEIDFQSNNAEVYSQATGIVKEEVEYDNMDDFDNVNSDYDVSEYSLDPKSESESSTNLSSLNSGFSWTPKTILLLLREYKLRLDKFRNPKYKKLDLWNEISDVFKSYGYDIHHALLNKKFRNLKNTFVNIFFSNANNRNLRSVKWEYYSIFLDIFKGDEMFNIPTSHEILDTSESIPIELLTDDDLNLFQTKCVKKSSADMKSINFVWNEEKCMLLLNEYKTRLHGFRDPKQQKKSLWQEIKEVFNSLGHTVDENILHKKFRNMKQTYLSHLNSGKQSKWIYQNIFKEIFSDDAISYTNFFSLDHGTDDTNLFINSESRLMSESSRYSSEKTSNYENSMLEIQNKRLRLDVEKTTELRKLRITMEENNQLQKRRNELLEELIDTLRERKDVLPI